MYKVEWSEKAEKGLVKINRIIAKKIKFGVENVLAKSPHAKGKPLKGKRRGQWSFRFSDYRVIYEIKQNELLILILESGHRKEIY